jgi:formate hydrogenlyase subunit 3/multisubunit Na+/H+ antiporter MnhD subunit
MLTALVLLAVAALIVVAVLATALPLGAAATPIVYAACGVICLAPLVGICVGLDGGSIVLPLGVPWVGAHFHIDPLAMFFLAVVSLGGAAASLFAIGYGRHESEPHRVLPFYPMFLAGMTLVVIAADSFTFLVSWEFMSLMSWALVMAHHRDPDNRYAGYVYIVMASAGTLALLLAFALLGAGAGLPFAAMREHALSPVNVGLVLALTLIGAGSKAGLVPLHVWLPLAHPAAPSHVSALMSGVMTKVATYAFVRIAFDLAGPLPWWWGTVVLTVGAVTAVMGVLYALMQHDLKRLLAYHTVENIGIIFIGLGLALAFRANGMALAAALALIAALFHVLNHSLFKSLLFFGSGAVLTATGERDMDRLGGLIHRMPATAFLFLMGCVAISALPPLNGFVSEWLTFQAILLSPDLPQWDLKTLVPAAGALLALSAALAAACFVKAYGVTFLGRPRSPVAAAAVETDRYSLAAMGALALLCLVAGVLPGAFIDALAPVALDLTGARLPDQLGQPWLSIVPIAASRSSYDGLLVFVFIVVSAAGAAFAIHRLASRATRRAPAWDCGFPDPSPATQYTAGSFAQPIRRVYGAVFAAAEHVEMPPPGEVRAARIEVSLRDLVWDRLYAPVAAAVTAAADWLNRFQFLTIRRYLSLVFAALVGLLVVLAVWQ